MNAADETNLFATEEAEALMALRDAVMAVDQRLARIEQMFVTYQPLIEEAARRMAGPLRWRKA